MTAKGKQNLPQCKMHIVVFKERCSQNFKEIDAKYKLMKYAFMAYIYYSNLGWKIFLYVRVSQIFRCKLKGIYV